MAALALLVWVMPAQHTWALVEGYELSSAQTFSHGLLREKVTFFNAVVWALGVAGIVLAYHLIGDGADKALDPRLRKGQRVMSGVRFLVGVGLGVGLALLIVLTFAADPGGWLLRRG